MNAYSLAFEYELASQGYTLVAGVDEVGRGCLAGPIVAAAVILSPDAVATSSLEGRVRDSKQMTSGERTLVFEYIRAASVDIGIGWSTCHVINLVGIAEANRRAMERAIRALRDVPDFLLVDYLALPRIPVPQLCMAKGDSRSLSVAAASVVAKVVRDGWMRRSEGRYPGYGFSRHKGYATPEHLRALAQIGPCSIHRRGFGPVADCLR